MKFSGTLGAAAAVALLAGGMASADVVDLGFAIDESGSVSSDDFALARDGLAAALNQIPTSGAVSYRISVVKFDDSVETVVPVTTIDSPGTLASVISTIQSATQQGGLTAIGSAIQRLTDNFSAVGLGDTTIFNVTTDGSSNSGIAVSTGATNAAAAGVDGLSYEAVGSASTGPLLATAFPGTPVLISDAADLPDDILTTSFVFQVNSFADYEAAIGAKVGKIVVDTGGGDGGPAPIPVPAGLPLLIGGMGLLALVRRRKG